MRTLLFLLLMGAGSMTCLNAQEGFQPRLLQVRLSSGAVPAGGSLDVAYWWQNAGSVPADSEWRVFVHVRRVGEAENAPNGVRLGADHDPSRPAFRWRAGQVVHYTSGISIPATTPPGDYVLFLGLFNAETGERYPLPLPLLPGENNRYQIARFRVLPAGSQADQKPLTATFAPVPAEPAAAAATAPKAEHTFTLADGPLSLSLDAAAPRVLSWRMNGAELPGDPEGEEPYVRILSLADHRAHPADAKPYTLRWAARQERGSVVYGATVREGEKRCLSFDLSFQVSGERATVKLANVVEDPGYQLLSVRVSRVAAARENARMALPFHAGRLVDPRRSTPTERSFSMDWGNQVLAGVVYDKRLLCAVEVPGIDDQLIAAVGEGWASLGASFQYRMPSTAPEIPALLLSKECALRLRFLAPKQGVPDWTDGARLLRSAVTARPPERYARTMIYKIFCDTPNAKAYTTFDQALALIRRVSNLTDGAPQVTYLVGWQHQGHDTGYPDVFTVNQRLGGIERLKAISKEAERYNALLSFHDNYDDAYKESAAWDPNLISRDARGDVTKGGVWGGGQSYIMSFSPRAVEWQRERVRRTLAMYPIRESYHIDVLSAVPRRYDFNPASPASGAVSLAGKVAIVREFNQHGVDVTSEGFCAPFVGVLGHAWHLIRTGETCFAGEEAIPFVPFIYHGHATWGGAKPSSEDIPIALLYGATFSADFNRSTSSKQITDSYYLLSVPWMLLRTREMTGYTAANGARRVSYGPDTWVEVADGGKRYCVQVDGRPIAVDFTCFAPVGRDGAWIAYSRDGGQLDYPAPRGWKDPARVHAVALTDDGPGAAVAARLENGRISLPAAAATAYRVTYGEK